MGVANYDCTSHEKTDCIFELLQKRYCSILHFCGQIVILILFWFLIEYSKMY